MVQSDNATEPYISCASVCPAGAPRSVLKAMGINIIRQGGSFADGSYYYWKNWRGLPWTRESISQTPCAQNRS